MNLTDYFDNRDAAFVEGGVAYGRALLLDLGFTLRGAELKLADWED